MSTRDRRSTTGGLVLALSTVLTLLVVAPAAASGPPGNNGTVKVHDAFEAEPIVQNEPHVSCGFHLHFFFADAGQAGTWWIEAWPPTGSKETVMGASSYGPTNAAGEWATGELSLAAGHYKVFWNGRNAQNVKHKVFWVEPCEAGIAPTPTPSPNGGTDGGGSGATASPAPRGGTQGSVSPGRPTLPNTAMEGPGSAAVLVLVLLLGGSTMTLVSVRRRIDRR
jgi:hypothetical protein